MIIRHPDELYVANFTDPNHRIRVGEVDIQLPDMPMEKNIIGYGKKSKDQTYQRVIVPPDIHKWKPQQIEDFVAAQWHRRFNGAWYFINGSPYYIPGQACMFFDFWTKKTGGRPDFRYEALEFFLFWQYIENDPNLYGMFDMKPRRIGDTEKALSIVYERTTRYKNVLAGMQSYTDLQGQKNFARLTKGYRGQPFFFKPSRAGSDKSFLAFMAPNEVITLKKLEDKASAGLQDLDVNIEDQFLGSYIDFEATVEGKYDGDQLFTYFLDEVFKIPVKKMDVTIQWRNIKRVMSLNNGQLVYGKAILCSTVEEKSKNTADIDDSTVQKATELFEQSDPNARDENGQTISGLARLFRDYELSSQVDEYGFPKREEARTFRKNKLAALQRANDYAGIIDLQRKEPSCVEDALTTIGNNCPLMPELCMIRLNQLRNGLDRYNNPVEDYVPKIIEGELIWKNNIVNGQVIFIPKKGGKWHISQAPIKPNNVTIGYANNKYFVGQTYIGQNASLYPMGCDPYDARYTIGKGSDGAFSVKRKLFLPHESKQILLSDDGFPINVEDMVTNTYVCDYKARPSNPYDFYMDVVKTCWFYGTQVFPENDKPGLQQWMVANGYFGFIKFEPHQIASTFNGRSRSPRFSIKASESIISMYVERLQLYIATYIWNNHHPRIIQQWGKFTVAKRSLFDLAVATGFTELADDIRIVEERKSDSTRGWAHSPFEETT